MNKLLNYIDHFSVHLNRYPIPTFLSVRFYVIFICYALAAILFASNSFFSDIQGYFAFTQGTTVFILSFVIVSSIAWESLLLGPARGANLLLHFCLIGSFSLLLAILLGSPTVSEAQALAQSSSLLADVWSGVKSISRIAGVTDILQSIVSVIPAFILDFFVNWRTSFLLLAILFVFCFNNEKLRLSLLIIIMFIVCVSAFNASLLNFKTCLGILFLCVGMVVEYCPYRQIELTKKVIKRLNQASLPPMQYRFYLELFLLSQDGPIDERIVAHKLCDYNLVDKQSSTDLIMVAFRQNLGKLGVLQLHTEHNRIYYKMASHLKMNDSVLLKVASIPRSIFALVFALIWVLSPIDLIPDAIPLVGLLDDMVITFFSSIVFMKNISPSNEL